MLIFWHFRNIGKHLKCLEISFQTIIWVAYYVEIAIYWPKICWNLRQEFQLSNVWELATIVYAYEFMTPKWFDQTIDEGLWNFDFLLLSRIIQRTSARKNGPSL